MFPQTYSGVVENRMDPLRLGRCQVRVHGLHTHDKSLLPTADLPWAIPLGPITSAAMNGIGNTPLGPVEGTVVAIFFRDPDQQQPVMFGTYGGIPQGEGQVDNDQPPLMFNDSAPSISTNDVPTPLPVTSSTGETIVTSSDGTAVTSGNGEPVTTGGDGGAIPGNDFGPRDGSNVKIPQTCHRGILAIGAAMDSAGITGSYARAAILGIVGGECDWIPQKESYGYSRDRIKEVFSWLTDAEADQYANWKGSREDFFKFIYGPTTRSGKNLGNKEEDDGAKYYGRGFIQLTGASNYKRYAKLSGVDIVRNPELLNDYEQGAKVAVWYFKDRVKLAQNDPGYFDAACAAVGYNVPNIKTKKQAYYKYFLLNDPKASSVPQETRNDAVVGAQPTSVQTAKSGLPVDRQKNVILGFRDPNMKYPLRDKLNEPDTNRLARGRVEGTSVQTRDNTRTMNVPTADGASWNQPPVPYNAQYPFNHVYESESGHLQEFDDTPSNERINWQHRSGTFTEVDCNGTQVNRIIGDGYEIVDRNGYVYVRGAYSITSEGFTTIFVNADAHVRVAGFTRVDAQQDMELNVSRDFDLNVGGNWNITVGGNKHTVILGEDITNITGKMDIKIGATHSMHVTGATAIESATDMSMKAANFNVGTSGNWNLKVGGNAVNEAGGTMGVKGGSVPIEGGSVSLKSGSAIKASPGLKVGGGAASAPSATDVPPIKLTPLKYPEKPEIGDPRDNFYDDLQTPPRAFEKESPYETPEEISTSEGNNFHQNREVIGEKSEPSSTPATEAPPILDGVGSSVEAIPQDRSDPIFSMDNFPLSLRLSENFTLGDLIRDPKHVIADQNLKDSANSNPRLYTKQEIVSNLKGVANNVLENIIKVVPGGKSGIIITSGYRFAGTTANESKTSDHPKGCAIDIVLAGKTFDYKAHYDLAEQLRVMLPYDQIILEYRDPGRPGNSRDKRICWIHISHKYQGSRRMAFTMLNDKTYSQGFSLLA